MTNFKQITAIFSFIFLVSTGYLFAQDRVVTYNILPQTAKNFLATNFRGIAINHIVEDREVFGIDEFKTYLSNGMKIEFDSKGNWIEVDGEHQKLPYGFIPNSIKNYVSKSFPNTFIIKVERKRWSYKAELSNGVDLEFDSKGNFTRIDD